MDTIVTKKGTEILIDKNNKDELSKLSWYVNKIGYAVNDTKPRKYMHRLIMGYPKENVDHINGNKLDNRKGNLRLCNQSENTANAPKRTTNKSGYKGVCWNKKYGKWEVYLTKNYKHIFLGYFDDKIDAARAYNLGAETHFGKFAKLNKLT
jgi:hypothetical protein